MFFIAILPRIVERYSICRLLSLIVLQLIAMPVAMALDVNGTILNDTNNNGYYEIHNTSELIALSQDSGAWGNNYELTADIDFYDLNGDGAADVGVTHANVDWDGTGVVGDGTDAAGFTPIGTNTTKFTGKFKGNGHVIKNLYINSTAKYCGLFGYIAIGSEINELGITVDNVATSSPYPYSGGLVGISYGTVVNCHVLVFGTLSSSASGRITSGGLLGENHGTVASCHAIITGAVRSSSSSGGMDIIYTGGLVGNNGGSVTACYATVSGELRSSGDRCRSGGLVGDNTSILMSCYATVSGIVTASGNELGFAGGLAGMNSPSSLITACYATVSGTVTASGGFGDYAGVVAGLNNGTIAYAYGFGSMAGIGGGTVSGCTDASGASPTPVQAIALMITDASADEVTAGWSDSNWATYTGGTNDYITRTTGMYANPVLAYELTPTMSVLSIDSGLSCYRSSPTTVGKTISDLLSTNISFCSDPAVSGIKRVVVTALPDAAYGKWYKNNVPISINDKILLTESINFIAQSTAATGTVTGLAFQGEFEAISGGRTYPSNTTTDISITIRDLSATLNVSKVFASGGNVTVTVSNNGTTANRWNVVESITVDGFSITSGATPAVIAAGGTATCTIAIAQNMANTSRNCTFYLQDGDGKTVQVFTITQYAAVIISTVNGTDPVSGNTVETANTIAITPASVNSFTTTDEGARDSSGGVINTGKIILSDLSSGGASVRSNNSKTSDNEVIIASLQNNGPLVTVTSQSKSTDSASGTNTASGIVTLDPTAVVPSSTNPVTVTLNDGTAMSVSSIPTAITPNYGKGTQVLLNSAGNKVSVETKITINDTVNRSATITLNMYLTRTSGGTTKTEFVEGPVFSNNAYVFSYLLSDLNFTDSANCFFILESDNRTKCKLYCKDTVAAGNADGYYEIFGDTVTFTIWHFSSISVSSYGAGGSASDSTGSPSCELTQNGTPYSLLPLLIILCLLAFLTKTKRSS